MITSATIFTIKPTTGPTRKIFGSFCSHLRDRYISFTRELSLQGNKADAERGSSPLTRGTQHCRQILHLQFRFIPAYAGNSCRGRSRPKASTVHPRLRGELTALVLAFFGAFGSSPLTRGTPDIGQRCIDPNRFIPAYAGNSIAGSRQVLPYPVHPRLRGELPGNSNNVNPDIGSSPLTRGTRL